MPVISLTSFFYGTYTNNNQYKKKSYKPYHTPKQRLKK